MTQVSHTAGGLHDYWRVDLGGVFDLSGVMLRNRTDCCSYRLRRGLGAT